MYVYIQTLKYTDIHLQISCREYLQVVNKPKIFFVYLVYFHFLFNDWWEFQ